MLKNAIKELMNWILNDIQSLSLDSGLLASISRDDQYSALWSQAQTLASGVFKTLALLVLAVFIMIEFLQISDRYTSNQLQDILKPFAMIAIKTALIITLINQSTVIMETLYNGFTEVSSQISATSSINISASLTDFNSAVDDMGFGDQIIATMVLLIAFLGTKVAWAFTQILVIGRFIQIYIYTAVAPAPLATLPNHEFSQIGKGFLKSFISICLQGCILVFVLYMFPILSATMINDIIPSGSGLGGVFTAFGTILVMLGALIGALKGAKSLADKVCGAM